MSRLQDAIRKAKENQLSRTQTPLTVGPSSPDANSASENRAQASRRRSGRNILSLLPKESPVADESALQEQRVIAASEYDDRVEPYRQLRTLILRAMRDQQWVSLAITSAHEGAGKTLTSSNLAISLSRDVNTHVQLVDLDLRTPTVHEKLNLQPDKGLVDYLEGNASLSEILYDPGLGRLLVLGGRPAGKFSSELLASPRMEELLADFCQPNQSSTITIFDLPPLLRNDDALLVTPRADATLFVVEDGATTVEQFEHSMRLLSDANVIGTILNKAGR